MPSYSAGLGGGGIGGVSGKRASSRGRAPNRASPRDVPPASPRAGDCPANTTFRGVDRDGAIEWRRHPADLARLVAASLALTVVLVLTAVEPDALTNLSDDLVDAARHVPASARSLVAGVLQVGALALPLVGLIWACLRRSWRPLLVTLAAALVAGGHGPAHRLARPGGPRRGGGRGRADSWITGRAFPSSTYLAAMAAVVIAVSPRSTAVGGANAVARGRVGGRLADDHGGRRSVS